MKNFIVDWVIEDISVRMYIQSIVSAENKENVVDKLIRNKVSLFLMYPHKLYIVTISEFNKSLLTVYKQNNVSNVYKKC